MPATISPCKRPKVTIQAHEKTFAATTRTGIYHLVTCHVLGCDFTYDAAVVTDAQEQAKRHRAEHRDAVPTTDVSEAPDGGYVAICACGWTAPTGTVTRADNEASLAAHLANAHGLVS